jgi:hypothetical protein
VLVVEVLVKQGTMVIKMLQKLMVVEVVMGFLSVFLVLD